MEIVLLIWVLILMTGWLARFLASELIAAARGHPSPQIARRRAREELRREFGTPTVGQALSERLARRIENPPDRKWLRRMRGLLAELAEDALAEARVRHHRNRQAAGARRRARQQAGWKVRTGGVPRRPAPPPEPEARPRRTHRCRDCPNPIAGPSELCVTCEQAQAVYPPAPSADPPSAPGPEPVDDAPTPPENDQAPPEREASPMAETATHTINGDVRDPRTALAFATACRQMNDAVARELDILGTNMQREGLGKGPLGEIRVLGDAARSYSASSRKSVEAYASHVVTQADIAGDDDLRNTVRRTYLDTRGGDGAATAPKGGGTTRTIRASDCATPNAAMRFMSAVADTYKALQASVDQAKGKHEQQGVSDDPVRFLAEQLEYATTVAQQAQRSAATFRRHIQKRDDTVGKDKSLGGTQKQKYLDPTKA